MYPSNKTRTAIQSCTRDIVELAPPGKVPFSHQVLEHEASRKPGRVIDTSGRRYSAHAVEQDGGADKLDPRVWVASLPEPERNR